MRPRTASAFGSGATAAARWGSRVIASHPHMQAVEGDPHAVFGLHLVPVVGLHQLTGAPWLNGEVEMTADVPAPPVQRLGYHSAGRFPSGRCRGGHRRQRLLPAGEAGAAPPVGVVLMRPQTQPAHRRLLIRHWKCSPTRGSGGRVSACSPSTANRRVPSAVKCMRQWLTITTSSPRR